MSELAAFLDTRLEEIVQRWAQRIAEVTPGEAALRDLVAAAVTEGVVAYEQHRARTDHQREQVLIEAQLLSESALTAGLVATFTWDIATDRLHGNQSFAHLFGVQLDASGAAPLSDYLAVIHPDDRATAGARVERSVQGTGPGEDEYRVVNGGRVRWVEARWRVDRDGAGRPLRCIGILMDITERRRLEEERAMLLESEREARQQAEEANRLKDQFLSTVSHELRTPLTSMLGWAQMLRVGNLTPERHQQGLATIERNARAQTQIIDDLLDMSRVLSGKLHLDVAPIDLAPVVALALETVRPAAEAKGVRLQSTIVSCGDVMGDAVRLQQVIWNLLTNGIKFTPRGGSVQVLVQCLDSSVDLTVADTGQGMSADFLPHVFERFRQADGSNTRAKGGLGLGLSIVRNLIELHGGTVSVFSEGEGKGASFTMRLPLSIAQRDEPGSLPGSDPAIGQRTGKLAGLRLLIVDDDDDSRAMLGILLESQGAEVQQASSAPEARQVFEATRPDVVVSDIGMPGENGYSFIRSLRALPREQGGRVPSIALTAYARHEDRARALDAGFSEHVTKPVNPRDLVAVIVALTRASG